MSEPAVPSSLGRYRVLGTIGSGGMGVVLRAFDPKLAREVAVKLLARELAQQPETVQRLRREAVAIARLSHPNIVRVFDSGEQDGIPFYVMELLAGVGLDVRASREPVAAPPGFDSKEFLALFTPLADALAAVHEAKLVHRDVKPSNVMTGVPERGPVLTDFGIAWIEGREGLTQAGMVMGTALYMSPERMRGRPADAMGDLYGLGQCMIEFATGRVVCSEVPRSELMRRRLTAEPPPLTTLAPEMPPVLAAIADRCSRLLPSDRFGSARELHAALKRAATDLGLGPRAPSARVSQQRELSRAPEIPPGRRRFPAIAAAAALLAVAVLLAWMRADSGRAERSPWSGPTADASRSAKPPSGPPVGRPRETRPVANQAIRDAPQPGRGVQSVTLTSASEQGHRVGLAASGTGSLLAAWVEPDGCVGLSLSRDRGATWTRPPSAGRLRASTCSELSLAGCEDRFDVLFIADGPRGMPWVYWSTTSREAVSWTTPVAVGQAFSAKERVLLAAPPGRSASHDRLLAVWRLPAQGPPGTAWLGPRPGVCLQVPGPAGTQGHGRVAAAILPNRESLLVWEYDNSRGGNWALLTSRAEAAAKSWFPAEPLRVESQGYDRIYPVLAVDGDRVWLQWAENRLPGHPLVVGISADGGRSFTGVGRVIWPYNKDPDSALMAAGRWVFSVASLPWPPRRVWSLSSDGGRHWTVPATVSSGDQERTAAVLLPADAGGAWLLFSDPAGQVRFARLP